MKQLIALLTIGLSFSSIAQVKGGIIEYTKVVDALPLTQQLIDEIALKQQEYEDALREIDQPEPLPAEGLSDIEKEIKLEIEKARQQKIYEVSQKLEQDLMIMQKRAQDSIQTVIQSHLEEFVGERELDFVTLDPATFYCPTCTEFTEEFIQYIVNE